MTPYYYSGEILKALLTKACQVPRPAATFLWRVNVRTNQCERGGQWTFGVMIKWWWLCWIKKKLQNNHFCHRVICAGWWRAHKRGLEFFAQVSKIYHKVLIVLRIIITKHWCIEILLHNININIYLLSSMQALFYTDFYIRCVDNLQLIYTISYLYKFFFVSFKEQTNKNK